MKKLIPVFALSLLTSFLTFAETDLPHITVYGTAEEMVVPDELNWSLSVKTVGASVEEAATNHLQNVSAVLSYLNGCIPKDEIKTSRMQLNENWVYRDKNRLKEGYCASTAISFKSKDFSKYTELWRQLAKFDNLSIGQVSFGISNLLEIQNATRLKAVVAAKKKAQALAETLGVVLLEPLVLEEIPNDVPAVKLRAAMKEIDSPSAEGISPGTQSVKSQVTLVSRIAVK